jgi:putative FmdB family regulatory protein
MPIYEYRCRTCAEQFETLVRASDTPVCPSCYGRDLEQMLSLFAVSSEGRSRAALKAARQDATKSKKRLEAIQHEREVVQEHLGEDYGIEPRPSEKKGR